jgi:phosphopentomutase
MASLGIGALPDAERYGDAGAHTLDHIAGSVPDLKIPNLIKLGLGNIDGVTKVPRESSPLGAYGRLAEMSKGKDTITGHWEIAGLYTRNASQDFPGISEGFYGSL